MNIELDHDTVGDIVVKDLKQSIRMTLDDPYDLYHDYEQAYVLVDSMLEVLQYYMVLEDFEDFVETLPERHYGQTEETADIVINTLDIIDVVDNPDGSADIFYEMPTENMQDFANSGVLYALVKSMLGNPSDDQLCRWAIRGKEEEEKE